MNDQQDSSPSELPPLRIHHFFAWMTVTAVLISVCLWFDRTARNGPPIKDRIVIASLIVAAVSIAGALTFAGYGLYWRKHGLAFPKYPGHWLLMVVAISAIGILAMLVGLFAVFSIEEDFLKAYTPLAGIALFAVG